MFYVKLVAIIILRLTVSISFIHVFDPASNQYSLLAIQTLLPKIQYRAKSIPLIEIHVLFLIPALGYIYLKNLIQTKGI